MYKSSYTKEEVSTLLDWFNTTQYDNEVDLGHGEKVNDVKKCVHLTSCTIQEQYANSTFSGSIALLYKIKAALIAQGKVH